MPALKYNKPQHHLDDDRIVCDPGEPSGMEHGVAYGLIVQICIGVGFEYIVQGQKFAGDTIGYQIAHYVQYGHRDQGEVPQMVDDRGELRYPLDQRHDRVCLSG